jgi:peptidoglycan/LPS O-acetylase OafA/YrhL
MQWKTITLNEALKKVNNNLDIVRLFAAFLVLYGHSFYLFHSNGKNDVLNNYLYYDNSGSIGVYIFFFLSGALITKSFLVHKNLVTFIKHRFLRIWPALIICILVTIFLVGPLFTTHSMYQYFHDSSTFSYLFKNAGLYTGIQKTLPGVYEKNVFPDVVNGSLWTLPIEIRCYLLVLILGLIKLLENKIILITLLCLTLVFQKSQSLHAFFLWGPEYVQFFIAGMLAYVLRDEIKINYKIAAVLLIICVVARQFSFNFFLYSFYALLLYLLLLAATLTPLKKIKMPGDYSYGVYIYAFIVQQSVSFLIPGISAYMSMGITIPITLLFAALSWHLIEKRFIKMGKSF